MRQPIVHLVQLEPMEERYTAQWARLFPEACYRLAVEHRIISGLSLGGTVETGTVLDAHGTNYYKATQLQTIMLALKCGDILRGDVLFFYDLWFPGMEMIAYVRDLVGWAPLIAGYLHAGTWTEGDFNQKFLPWGRDCERVWQGMTDRTYVGSQYHANRLMDIFGHDESVVVTGAPVAVDEIVSLVDLDHAYTPERTWDVIWPHRWDMAKRPDVLLDVARAMPDLKFLVTTSRRVLSNEREALALATERVLPMNVEVKVGLTKRQYYECLWRSKIILSTSLEESWGYGVAEGICAGCVPLVPDAASNPEHVRRALTYDAEPLIYPLSAEGLLSTSLIVKALRGAIEADYHIEASFCTGVPDYREWCDGAPLRMIQDAVQAAQERRR